MLPREHLPSASTGKVAKTAVRNTVRVGRVKRLLCASLSDVLSTSFPLTQRVSQKGSLKAAVMPALRIAGYNMSPGDVRDGEYLCWSLKELANNDMMAKASKHPPGLQSPHVTKKIRLPSGNICHFPLKDKYDRQFRTIDGIDEAQTAVQSDNNVVKHIFCPDEHVDVDIPDATKPVPIAAEGSSSTVTYAPATGSVE